MVVVNIPIKILGRPSAPPTATSHSRSNSTSSTREDPVYQHTASNLSTPNSTLPRSHSPNPQSHFTQSTHLGTAPGPRPPSSTFQPSQHSPNPQTHLGPAASPRLTRSRPVSRQSQAEDPERPSVIPLPYPTTSNKEKAESSDGSFEKIEQPIVEARRSTLSEEEEEGVPQLDSAKKRKPKLKRNQSVVDFNAKTIVTLDQIEQKVEQFRKAAAALEAEKEQILRQLSEINVHSYMLKLAECDREEIVAVTDRLTKRTKTVQVLVETPRNEEQRRALEAATEMVEELTAQMRSDITQAKLLLETYLNACSSEETTGATNTNFLKVIIECTADDQKRVKRRLESLLAQIECAEKTTAVLLENEQTSL